MNLTVNKSFIMTKAHDIAKMMTGDFGARISFGLRKAWKIARKMIIGGSEMVELKGSEKQIKWATDIRENMLKVINSIATQDEIEKEVLQEVKNAVESNSSSSWFIENRMGSVASVSMELEDLKLNELKELRNNGIRKASEEYITKKEKYTEYKEKSEQAFSRLINYKF